MTALVCCILAVLVLNTGFLLLLCLLEILPRLAQRHDDEIGKAMEAGAKRERGGLDEGFENIMRFTVGGADAPDEE